MTDWAKKLKHRMIDYNIQSKDLAEQMGLSRQYVSMVLHGKEKPKDAEARFNKAVDEIIAANK